MEYHTSLHLLDHRILIEFISRHEIGVHYLICILCMVLGNLSTKRAT